MKKNELKLLQNDASFNKNRGSDFYEKRSLFFDNLITVQELAGAFGFAPKTIQNWIYLKKIPYVKIGGKVLFRQKSIEEWLKRKEFRPCQ